MSTNLRTLASYGIIGFLLAATLVLSACSTGSLMTVAAGPTIGAGAGLAFSVEYTHLHHEKPHRPVREEEWDPRGPRRLLGWGWTGSATGGLTKGTGWYTTALGGFDYVPFLYDDVHVTFGALAGYGAGAEGHGFAMMLPRLGFALTSRRHGTARVGMGARLQGIFFFPSGSADSSEDSPLVGGVGPALTFVRIRLGD